MKFDDAVKHCHVRSGIYRKGDPVKIFTEEDLLKIHPAIRELNRNRLGTTVPKVYWKNHQVPLSEQVPHEDQLCSDWEEYDPREQPECSAYNEMPA